MWTTTYLLTKNKKILLKISPNTLILNQRDDTKHEITHREYNRTNNYNIYNHPQVGGWQKYAFIDNQGKYDPHECQWDTPSDRCDDLEVWNRHTYSQNYQHDRCSDCNTL